MPEEMEKTENQAKPAKRRKNARPEEITREKKRWLFFGIP